MSNKTLYGYKIASRSTRFFASLIECIVIIAILTLITRGQYLTMTTKTPVVIDLVFLVIDGLLFGAICYPFLTGNIGHRIFGLKVISTETGKDCNAAEKGAIRECLKNVLGLLIIPLFWIFFDSKNQTLHDKISKTVVVKKHKKRYINQ